MGGLNMKKLILIIILLLNILIIDIWIRADSWGPPCPEHWSSNKQFVLKVKWRIKDKELSLWQKTEKGLKKIWGHDYGTPHTVLLKKSRNINSSIDTSL